MILSKLSYLGGKETSLLDLRERYVLLDGSFLLYERQYLQIWHGRTLECGSVAELLRY
jgi:hypothetical protein